jgi:hypothetical protein
MVQALLKFLAGGAADKVGDYFVQKQALKHQLKLKALEGKMKVTEAKYEARARREGQTHSWEMQQIQNSGWKDEVVLAVLLMPYVGAFVPVVQDYVLVGFTYLAQMPYWAVGLTVTVMLAVYGIRHKNASKIQAPGLRDGDVPAPTTPAPRKDEK